jgi:hypothetical protein
MHELEMLLAAGSAAFHDVAAAEPASSESATSSP